MKHIFGRIIILVMIVLILLPPLTCLIFYGAARQSAYDDARRDLENMQAKILPLMESSFPQGGDTPQTEENDPVRTFLSRVTPMVAATEGNAKLMILAGRTELNAIYPRDEKLRAEVAPLAETFANAISEGDTALLGSSAIEANGEEYLINVYAPPLETERLRYIIAYCPSSEIGGWIGSATVMVLVISSIFAALAFIVIWVSVKGITKPILRLCTEAENIGGGSFEHIEPVFPITELEELRVSMNTMTDRLMRADENQKHFFQNVSHELRNPLMSISGYAQGIEQGVFPSPEEAAHTILSESMRLTDVVTELLTLSRLESDAVNIVSEPVRVSEVIESSVYRINGTALQKGVTVTVEPFDEALIVSGSEEMLAKVLDNLLSNAVRFAAHSVVVAVKTDSKNAVISVSDDGEGIADEDMTHLFERCYKGKGGNFGVGLAIAHSAAEKMNGTLTAENRDSGGAVFGLKLLAIH